MQSSSRFPDEPGALTSHQSSPSTVEQALADYERRLEERLERGLAAIQAAAVQLMKEIAAEMWRSSGADASEAQARILQFVSRDQAIKTMLAHTDERFQALALRSDQLEDTLRQVHRSNAELADHIARSSNALTELAHSPALQNAHALREQLEQVERHIASTIAYIADRDRELVARIDEQVRDNGDVVTREAGRIVEAMQGYVKDGVDTMGRLAQRMEAHITSTADRDDELTDRIHAQIQTTLGEQIQLLYERLGIESRTLADTFAAHETWMSRAFDQAAGRTDEQLHAQAETIRESARLAATEVTRLLEARVMGLAQLVRSDSEALRRRLVETAAAQDEAVGRMLDERLVRVSEAVDGATRVAVEESLRRIADTTERAVEGKIDGITQATERAIDGRIETITLALDRNLVILRDRIDAQGSAVADRAAEAAGAKVDAAASRLEASVVAIDGARAALEGAQAGAEGATARAMDARIAGLAKMIRSDNEKLAARIESLGDERGDQDAAKQALRAVKELQASLGNELSAAMDRRFSGLADQLHRETQSMAESIARSSEVLTRRIESVQSQAGGREMQTVIEKMGDAMHALAAIGRRQPPEDRIELE